MISIPSWCVRVAGGGLAAMVGFVAPVAQAQTFNDLSGHWAQLCVLSLAKNQVAQGYPDGSFRPNEPVSRVEYAAMVSKAFPQVPRQNPTLNFRDLDETYWGLNPIRQAVQSGFMTGYPSGVFLPSNNITRLEVLVSLVAGLNYGATQPIASTLRRYYQDHGEILPYGRDDVMAATENHLVVNYPYVDRLRPQDWASRGEVAAMICQALGSQNVVDPQYIP